MIKEVLHTMLKIVWVHEHLFLATMNISIELETKSIRDDDVRIVGSKDDFDVFGKDVSGQESKSTKLLLQNWEVLSKRVCWEI